DTEGSVYNSTGFLKFDNARITLKLPTVKFPFSVGLPPDPDSPNIFVENRFTLLEDELVNVSLFLWERPS
ncbi:hypothetical protein KY320_02480, partial [Candidatus Woesearchaeota archaeon]|nr:hypothetical protein [Candidatus Woesearchaeota archaeon]